MPWTKNDVSKHKKGLTDKQKGKWADIANKVLNNCQKQGGQDCEAKAIQTANSKVQESMSQAINIKEVKYSGTEDNDWSQIGTALEDFVSAMPDNIKGDKEINTVEDLSKKQEQWIGKHHLIYKPDEDTFSGKFKLPIVNPQTGKLNRNAVASAKTYVGRTEGIDQSTAETKLNNIWDKEFAKKEESMDDTIQALNNEISELREAGRKISKANEKKIRDAITALTNILQQLQTSESKQFHEMWHSDLKEILENALRNKYTDARNVFVDDFDENWVVFAVMYDDSPEKQMRVNYTLDENNNVTFGEPVEVVRKVVYQPISNQTESKKENKEDKENKESQIDIQEEPVKLDEAKVSENGEIPIKVISPGWGSSGYYPELVLQKDADKYKKGTQMFWDHPTKSEEKERPEGSLKNLAATLTSDGQYKEDGPHGPGIYANAKVRSEFLQPVKELAQNIGISHRAAGRAKKGEAEGKKGPVIEGIDEVRSVDFVTMPGAGGQVTEMFESYKPSINTNEVDMTEQEKKEFQESIESLKEENKRLKEEKLLKDAKEFISQKLAEEKLPEPTKNRLTERLANDPAQNEDGSLNQEKMKEAVDKAIKEEKEYLSSIVDSGKIKGMGESAGNNEDPKQTTESLTEAFKPLLGEEKAKVAAEGR